MSRAARQVLDDRLAAHLTQWRQPLHHDSARGRRQRRRPKLTWHQCGVAEPVIEWTDVLDESAFDRLVLAAHHPVVVAFESGDCVHCREQRSLLALAWRHLGTKAPTVYVDVGRLPALARRYRVVGCPTIAVFSGGQLLERYPDTRDPGDLTRRLLRLLAARPTEPEAPRSRSKGSDTRMTDTAVPADRTDEPATDAATATHPGRRALLETLDVAGCGCCCPPDDSATTED